MTIYFLPIKIQRGIVETIFNHRQFEKTYFALNLTKYKKEKYVQHVYNYISLIYLFITRHRQRYVRLFFPAQSLSPQSVHIRHPIKVKTVGLRLF